MMFGAEVTFDVAIPKVVWGWLVSTNMWAKSIATGTFLVGLYFVVRYPDKDMFFRKWIPILGLVFIGITLLVTVLDLHHISRFWKIFVHPHFTSAVTLGAWVVSAFVLVLVVSFWSWVTGNRKLFERIKIPGFILAFFSTIYTAGIMGQSTAREIWIFPVEIFSMLLSALLAGSAAFLFIDRVYRYVLDSQIRKELGYILFSSAGLLSVLYIGELFFAKMHSEFSYEVVKVLAFGDVAPFFWSGLVFGLIIPMILVGVSTGRAKEPYAFLGSLSALVGLWLIKHAWLVAPQYIPLS
ncbi:NrfD/PsrC family molybdoenzyme membrane anchor subunit [Persephonella sp.]